MSDFHSNLFDRIKSYAKNVLTFCRGVSLTPINSNIVSQLIRSATSVGANYSEACETTTPKDFAYKILISKREAKESEYWLEMLSAVVTDTGQRQTIMTLSEEALQLIKILNSIYSKHARNTQSPSLT